MQDLYPQFQQPLASVDQTVVQQETFEPSVITSDSARRKVQQSMVQLQEILNQLSGKPTI